MGALKLENLQYTYDDYKLWEGDWELNDLKDTLCNVKINFEKVFRRFRK